MSEPKQTDALEHLSQRQMLACIDDQDRCRCLWCGRYARLEGMRPMPPMVGEWGRIIGTPMCVRCEAAS